jgi:tRNA (cytidine/uridine-2'-O-)-methyltransferase
MRTCVGINAKLHLIKPLGFSLDEKYLRRSALDYIKDLNYTIYENYADFSAKNPGQYFFLTRYGKKTYSEIDYTKIEQPIYLIFGKESTGVDRTILAAHMETCYRIPTTDKIRSLNLSNAVALVAFEVMRQVDFEGLHKYEPDTLKGKDFLDQFK